MRMNCTKPLARLNFLIPTLAFAALTGCSSSAYHRGSTNYQAGTANVKQPNIKYTANRNFDGFRVAGFDSDVDPQYWDEMLIARGQLGTFELFEQRYHDLEIYQTGACAPILKSFRTWARRRNLEEDFSKFWQN